MYMYIPGPWWVRALHNERYDDGSTTHFLTAILPESSVAQETLHQAHSRIHGDRLEIILYSRDHVPVSRTEASASQDRARLE